MLLSGLASGQSTKLGREVPAATSRQSAQATRPQPEMLAWGWYPPALNSQVRERVDSVARLHVALLPYQADAQGRLTSLSRDPAAQVAAAHRLSPGTPVLLRLRYQEAAIGTSLFAPGQSQARQALADTLGRQLAATHADGLALAVSLKPAGRAAALAAAARPLHPGERLRVLGILNKQRLALNADSGKVKLAKADIAWLQARLRVALPATERAHFELLLRKRRQEIGDFRQRLTTYRQSKAELGSKLFPKALLPTSSPAPISNAAGLQAFVRLLRQQLDVYRANTHLAFTLPLRDSSQQRPPLASLLSDVDFFLLLATADSTGQPGVLEQLSQLRAAVQRYQAAGLPANRLRVVFPHSSPAQPRPAGKQLAFGKLKPAAAPGMGRLPSWAHLALFATALLVGFALGGVLLSALLRAPAIIPFRQRLLRVGGLLGAGLLLLLGYSYLLGPADGRPLLYTCLVGLALLGAGLLYHRYRQPAQLP